MFRSRRRDVVYPQAEHARFAAAIAAAWGNERFARPPVDFDAFVRGVALHDRGYGELDDDPIFGVPIERWLELQRRGFEPRGEDPVVDLVVALHVARLVSWVNADAARAAHAELEARLPALRAAAAVSAEDAAATDAITDLCDRIAFDMCFEEPAQGSGAGVAYELDGDGNVRLDPWPLGVPWLAGVLVGFRADGYPREPVPVAQTFRIEAAAD